MLLRVASGRASTLLDGETFHTRSRRTSGTSTRPSVVWFHRGSELACRYYVCHRVRRSASIDTKSR